jgi:ubiquinone/menaquinone biosynthesis C-methylase UbiE
VANKFIKHYDVERSYQIFLELSKEHKPLALDVGCGNGRKTLLFKKVTSDIIGLDTSIEKLRIVRERGINAICADAQSLPFRSSCFDALLSFHNLEHLTKPAQALEEAYRVLKPKGFLLLVTPNRLRATNRIALMFIKLMKLSLGSKYPLNPDHIFEFDKETLRSLINKFFSKMYISPLFIGLKLANLCIKVKFPEYFCDQWILLAIKD